MTSTEDRAKNLAVAHRLTRRAAAEGALLVALPENFTSLRLTPTNRHADDLDGELVERLREWASTLGIYLLAGSIPERIPGSRRVHNTSLLLSPAGRILAVYRKLHLFDIHLRGKAVFEESKLVAPGEAPVVADTPLGKLGLSICYDLRFPELYRRLAMAGAEVLFVPSAFTAYTGKFHWMPLLQARAIENQCWVVAPAQTGVHGGDRASFGHTAVLDPWGTTVAVRPRGAGVVLAEVDLDRLERVRAGLPCLQHARPELLGFGGKDVLSRLSK
jgi:predicted amidohydrolase